MKKAYSEFYQPTEEKFQELWKESHFVFDANTLLNLYMYTEETVNDFLKVLDNIQDRIWISFQAGYEFHLNRPVRIRTQQILFQETIESLSTISDDAKKSLKNTFHNTREHPSIDEKEILADVSDFFDLLIDRIKSKRDEHPDWLLENDEILNQVSNLFDGKVGKSFISEELEEIYKEGDKRYKKEIPPGFEDANNKDSIRKYGDLVIWKEILKFAKNDDVKSIIFVTDDRKKDWWRIASGRTIGPHPDLIKEFKENTEKDYYQYNSERFLKFAKDNLIEVSDESISETKRVSDSVPSNISFEINENRLKELARQLIDQTKPLHNLRQEQIDRITGETRLKELARQVMHQNKPLPELWQDQIDRITGEAQLNDIARQFIHRTNALKNLSDDKSNQDSEENDSQNMDNESDRE